MGRSAPPFLYDPPSEWNFNGSIDKSFNPKAVTQANATPEKPKTKQDGPLVTFNRHPDSYSSPYHGRRDTSPMSPYTKSKVKYVRIIQLLLRICALSCGLATLFCVICIKNTGIIVGWIIRVAPAIAILHTIYAIYHLCRSAAGRPPASTASYMLFAATLDAGIMPFYVFTAFMARGQYTTNAYDWDTLFQNPQATHDIAYASFLVAATASGLHGASFIISIYLAVIFRQIARLPPDMNPLEETLTARRHKRNKSEISEKHLSQGTLDSLSAIPDSGADDPLILESRSIPFTHTRQGSSDSMSNPGSPGKKRASRASIQSHRMSRADLPSQQRRLYENPNTSTTTLSRAPAQKARESPSRPVSMIISEAPTLQPAAATQGPSVRWGSPVSSLQSDNWVTYPSPTSSPVNENIARRSSLVSDRTISQPSLYSDVDGASEWFITTRGHGYGIDDIPKENAHIGYSSLNNQENQSPDEEVFNAPKKEGTFDDTDEQDLGERQENGLLVGERDILHAANPLGMNPPTPQPKEDDIQSFGNNKSSLRRIVLTDIPNLSVGGGAATPPKDNFPSKPRFYGDLEGRTGLSVPRAVSSLEETGPPSLKKSLGTKKLWRRKTGRTSVYEPLKNDDDSDSAEEDVNLDVQRRPKTSDSDGDRKGRVVSNSGIDLGTSFQLGSGSPSYGNYIAGLGVGRRRDVSGKVAEEGRGGARQDEREQTPENAPNEQTSQLKAAGWARFAGL